MYKKRFWIKLLVVFIVIAGVLGGALYVFHTYTIRNVYVEGNLHYTEEEIKDIVMSGRLGNNSLYLSMKYKNKGVKDIPFVDVMDVSILSPDTIKITVYEKALAGYIAYLDTFFYFDKDGYVVESSSVRTVGVPQITGLTFDSVVLGERLPVENQEIFDTIFEITKLLNKYELTADKIYFHASNELTLYFGDVKVALGNEPQWLEDKVMRLPIFLETLEGRSGTLQMETYEETNGSYSFKPE